MGGDEVKCPKYVRFAINTLESSGYEAFVVGGGLRDTLLGRAPDDFDIATSALPEQTLSVFSDFYTIPTGLKHGTVTVMIDGAPLEITTYRIDGEYSDSRHPESVVFASKIEEDLSRRDFTVNAMAYNERVGFVDVFGGMRDLEAKILRAVGEADKRMEEDALRIMRAFRFSAQLSFDIEENTLRAIRDKAHLLSNISGERKGVELLKLLTSKSPEGSLRNMIDTGVWKVISPEFVPSERSISALQRVESDPCERLAALLFDCDTETARRLLRSLKYSNAIISSTLTLIQRRSCAFESDADLRRFIIHYGELSASMARIAEALGEKGYPAESDVLRMSSESFCRSVSDLAIGGDALLKMGFEGKEIGKALNRLFETVIDDPSANTAEKLTSELERIKKKE